MYLGRFIQKDEEVPTLNGNESKAMVDRMSQVFKPFELEDLHAPTQEETWAFTKKRIPILEWGQVISWRSLRADIVAGLTILVMVVPQSMSYADIAGLPLIYGLYSTMLPCFVYGFTGTSRQLAVGPTALISILTNAALDGLLTDEDCPEYANGNNGDQTIGEVCPDAYANLAIMLAFTVGLFQICAAILQLGFIVNFLGHPVISGFTSAAAFLIALTQVKNILGFSIKKSQYIYVTVGEIVNNISETNPVTAVLGFSFIFMMLATKKIVRTYPRFSWLRPLGPLIFCLLGSIIVAAADLDQTQDVEVVGPVPGGLPPAASLDFGQINKLIVPSITITIISYMESIAISKSLAAQHGYEVDSGQELFSLGLTTMFGSFLSGFPVTGSFSRSAVNNSVGAMTQLAGIITGLGVILTLAVLTPIFAYLPKFVLGAIVVSSVVNLFAYEDAIHLWHVKKTDCALWFIAFLGTLFLGILWGLVTAAAVSLVIVIYESVRPQVSLIWRVKGTNYYRSVKQAPSGEWVKGVLIVRFGAPMYFANMSFIRDTIQNLMSEGAKDGARDIEYVVLEMSPVTNIDSSAIHILEDTAKEFKKRNIQLCFANTGNRVERVFERAHFQELIGDEWFHGSTAEAVQQCLRHKRLGDDRTVTKIEEQEDELKEETV